MDLSTLAILHSLGDEYILLKRWDNFPAFLPGSDVDILVVDRYLASQKIQKYLNSILDHEEYFLQVTEGTSHIHVDVIHGKDIWIRCDLIDDFDYFTRFSIQNALKIKLFLSREKKVIDHQEVYVPSPEFDYLLRYFEYLEYFETRQDKIKHLDYILANATSEQQAELINDAHRYIRFNHLQWQGKVPAKTNSIQSRKQAIKEILRLSKWVVQISWLSIKSKLK
jgi:hypothetical protein